MFEFKSRLGSVKFGQRGISNVVSVMLITAFIIMSVVAIMFWALPVLEKSQKITELERMKASLSKMDEYIRTVAHSGVDSTKSVFVDVSKGELELTNDYILYTISIGEELVKSGVVIKEKKVWIEGVSGGGIRLRLNYTNIQLNANDVIIGKRTLIITKTGETGGKPLVEVKTE